MTCPLPRMRPHVCQIDSTCGRPPRFQARLAAVHGVQPVRQNAEACVCHLADLVQAFTTWARGYHLTEACCLPQPVLDSGARFCIFVLWI